MLKLTAGMHGMLNDRVISVLREKGIRTISELLQTDSNKLKTFLNIELIDLGNLKNDLWKLVGIIPITGHQHYHILTDQSTNIVTGIKSLDDMLNGGFFSGSLIDLCGMSASGKTQLYTTIALNLAISNEYETFVIDTKGDFSGDRINRMLINRGEINADKRKKIMRHIKVEKCVSPTKLIESIRNLIQQASLYPKFKMLVIDSVPALWFQYHGNRSSYGIRNLAILADLLRKLAVECGIVVIAVNIETRINLSASPSDECMANDLERNDSSLMNRTTSLTVGETTVPALGKHWTTICSLRLQIERQHDATNGNNPLNAAETNKRTIRILKGNQMHVNADCLVHLTDAGVT